MMMPSSAKVIIIGCHVAGLAIAKAFANKGIHVIAISASKNDIAHLSKYVNETARLPDRENKDKQFLGCLMQNVERWKGALILESEDYWSICISKHKEHLQQFYKIVTPDWQVLSNFIKKEKTYKIAEECLIPHPKSLSISSIADIEKVAPEIRFPCILKPTLSHEFKGLYNVKNFEVNNISELKQKFKLCLDAGQSMIIQEIIPGPDDNLYKLQGYVNSRGKMVGKFFYRKLRQNPPQFGIARVGISTDRYPEVEQLTGKLLGRTNYRGYFSNEFKKDPRDGQLKLIENNCRMPRSGMLAIACGVNFPWLMYQDLVLNQQSDVTEYKTGLYWIELYADVFNSIFRHKMEDISVRDYLRPYLASNKTFADWDPHDIKPFLKLTTTLGKTFWKSIKKF